MLGTLTSNLQQVRGQWAGAHQQNDRLAVVLEWAFTLRTSDRGLLGFWKDRKPRFFPTLIIKRPSPVTGKILSHFAAGYNTKKGWHNSDKYKYK